MTKLTKKVALSYAVATLTDAPMTCDFSKEEIIAKLNEMIENLDKKGTGEKALTDNQKANVGYKVDILNCLADGKERTATEILTETPAFIGTAMTNQRVSALLRQLILENKVKKEIRKGKAYFSVVEGE